MNTYSDLKFLMICGVEQETDVGVDIVMDPSDLGATASED